MRITAAAVLVAIAISRGADIGFQAPTVAEFKSMAVVALKNGPNQVDLDGDGRMDVVFVAWRENFNAHGFNYITFYRSAPGTPAWNLVPFVNKEEMPAFRSFETSQGADCVLRDVRILRPRDGSAGAAVVVVAERPFGESFAAEQPVGFTVYRLARNAKVPGAPELYFRAAGTIVSKAAYCDVGDAFTSELGIAGPRE